MKNAIKSNHKFTEKLVGSLFEEKGNAFYLISTHATFSRVWTYSEDKIEIYKLARGKIYKQEEYETSTQKLNQIPTFKEIHEQLKDCGYELDGDGFGFKLNGDSGLLQEDFPVNIECFKNNRYHSDFLTFIVNDINTYQMWEIEEKDE